MTSRYALKFVLQQKEKVGKIQGQTEEKEFVVALEFIHNIVLIRYE